MDWYIPASLPRQGSAAAKFKPGCHGHDRAAESQGAQKRSKSAAQDRISRREGQYLLDNGVLGAHAQGVPRRSTCSYRLGDSQSQSPSRCPIGCDVCRFANDSGRLRMPYPVDHRHSPDGHQLGRGDGRRLLPRRRRRGPVDSHTACRKIPATPWPSLDGAHVISLGALDHHPEPSGCHPPPPTRLHQEAMSRFPSRVLLKAPFGMA